MPSEQVRFVRAIFSVIVCAAERGSATSLGGMTGSVRRNSTVRGANVPLRRVILCGKIKEMNLPEKENFFREEGILWKK